MNIDELKNEYKKDCIINDEQLDIESLNISKLHSKYLNILTDNKLFLSKLIRERKKLENVLEDYYEGSIDGKLINRKPFTRLINTKSKIEKLISSDDEYQILNEKISNIEEIVLFLKEVIGNINRRSFDIKNAIEYKKFISGI